MVLTTHIDNETRWGFEFDVEGGGVACPLRALPPGATQTLRLSRVKEICKKRGPDWRIRVLFGNDFTGMYLHAYKHLLLCTTIVFKCGPPDADGFVVPFVIGIKEKKRSDGRATFTDYVLRHRFFRDIIGSDNDIWKKRRFTEIAQADPEWTRNLREIEEAPQNVAPLVVSYDNTISLRLGESSSTSDAINTSPPQQKRTVRRRATIPYSDLRSGVLAFRQFNIHINILLFVLALASVGLVWWMDWQRLRNYIIHGWTFMEFRIFLLQLLRNLFFLSRRSSSNL